MRNDSNDSMLAISDYILQMIEQSKRQKEIDMKRTMDQGSKLQQNYPPLSAEHSEEAEYDLYYVLEKEHHPDLFEIKGSPVETFPVDKDKSVFQIYQDKENFFGIYKQEEKEAHKITPVFSSIEDVLQDTFGTSQFEKFRRHSFFIAEDGKAFSLHENQQLRLNLAKPYTTLITYENIEQARFAVLKDELKNDRSLLKQALRRTLDENNIPLHLLGKTVTLQSISKNDEGIQLSIEENKKDIRLPDIEESWIERVRSHPNMKAVFDEIVTDSRSISEGFIAFYGMEINKEIQTKQHDFEVISNQTGSYIGKLSGDGMVKKVSPYFTDKEAEKQLGNYIIIFS